MRFALLCFGLLAILPLVIATFKCKTRANTTLVHNVLAEQQKRAASPFVAQLAQPWPVFIRNGRRLRVIRYCYDDAVVKQIFCQRIQSAFTIWANAIGYPASQAVGHNIAWEEAHDDAPPSERQVHYCHLPGTQNWNPEVAKDTLRIQFYSTHAYDAEASVGWQPETAGRDGSGRHGLSLGSLVGVETIVHELGHVFGMNHEFIRNDRDDYILYQCQNVAGFYEALQGARASFPPGSTEAFFTRMLCEDWRFAEDFDFMGAEFIKNRWGVVDDDSPTLDVDSVMMYDSTAFANPECPDNMNYCPLLKYTPPGQTQTKALIPLATKPSAGDVAWLKKWYPWED